MIQAHIDQVNSLNGQIARMMRERDDARGDADRRAELLRDLEAELRAARKELSDSRCHEHAAYSLSEDMCPGCLERQRDENYVEARNAKEALKALYTFPRVKELLAPPDSLGSIRALVEAVLKCST